MADQLKIKLKLKGDFTTVNDQSKFISFYPKKSLPYPPNTSENPNILYKENLIFFSPHFEFTKSLFKRANLPLSSNSFTEIKLFNRLIQYVLNQSNKVKLYQKSDTQYNDIIKKNLNFVMLIFLPKGEKISIYSKPYIVNESSLYSESSKNFLKNKKAPRSITELGNAKEFGPDDYPGKDLFVVWNVIYECSVINFKKIQGKSKFDKSLAYKKADCKDKRRELNISSKNLFGEKYALFQDSIPVIPSIGIPSIISDDSVSSYQNTPKISYSRPASQSSNVKKPQDQGYIKEGTFNDVIFTDKKKNEKFRFIAKDPVAQRGYKLMEYSEQGDEIPRELQKQKGLHAIFYRTEGTGELFDLTKNSQKLSRLYLYPIKDMRVGDNEQSIKSGDLKFNAVPISNLEYNKNEIQSRVFTFSQVIDMITTGDLPPPKPQPKPQEKSKKLNISGGFSRRKKYSRFTRKKIRPHL